MNWYVEGDNSDNSSVQYKELSQSKGPGSAQD